MPRAVISMDELKTLVGREIGVTEYFRVSQERIDRFADAVEDRQWIHTDVVRAREESPYGGTIAHGFLTLSLIGYLSRELIEVTGARLRVNYGLDRVRFPAALPADQSIRVRLMVRAVEKVKGGVQLKAEATVEREGSPKPCCVAEWLIRYYR
jgi:acyl dehydratase